VSADWAAAQARGVAVLDPSSYQDDGDFYTLEGVSRPVPTGPPVLSALNPDTMPAAGPDVTLDCQGSGFSPDTVIAFGGRAERTDHVDDQHVKTGIRGGGMWAPGTVQVAVASEGRGSSQSLPFTFT
jgi:hypothetical protein